MRTKRNALIAAALAALAAGLCGLRPPWEPLMTPGSLWIRYGSQAPGTQRGLRRVALFLSAGYKCLW